MLFALPMMSLFMPKTLNSMMNTYTNIGIKLNKDKLQLRMDEITFMGHRVTRDGLWLDSDKIKVIVEMPTPENVEQL